MFTINIGYCSMKNNKIKTKKITKNKNHREKNNIMSKNNESKNINIINHINITDHINITNHINIYKKMIKNYIHVLVDIQKMKYFASIHGINLYHNILIDSFEKKWMGFLMLTCRATILKINKNINLEFYCKKHQSFFGPYIVDTYRLFSSYQIMTNISNSTDNSLVIKLPFYKNKINNNGFYNNNGLIFFNPDLLLDHMCSLGFSPRSYVMTCDEVIAFLNMKLNVEFIDKYYSFIENIMKRIKPFG